MKAILQVCALMSVALLCLCYVADEQTRADSEMPNAVQGAREASVLYAKNCANCHGKDGRAKTLKAKFNHARDLTDSAWQANTSEERIFNSIANGRGKMPAYGKKFSDKEIESLVSYVRRLKK
ncbi:MAG TPA: cytochrome c [Pyrinomonadaceae bacterium]|jgi:cbb3-type cytochrome c oxidase subunit III